MTQPLSPDSRTLIETEDDLRREGFSEAEILELTRIREMYPFIEYVDSRYEWHRLKFVKWLYHQGEFTR